MDCFAATLEYFVDNIPVNEFCMEIPQKVSSPFRLYNCKNVLKLYLIVVFNIALSERNLELL